ncbi:MAG: FAD-binding oxidoreductase [Burkholderiaceae bacterium]
MATERLLADGMVLGSMNRMLKHNAGYDLKQLFIGSEGTLGVITRLASGGEALIHAFLEAALTDGHAPDAVAAHSVAQRQALWAVRDSSGELHNTMGPCIAFDISIPFGDMPALVADCALRIAEVFPGARPVFFGHIADSNLHICVTRENVDPDALDRLIYDAVGACEGSVSAEHGIGLLKRDYLDRGRSAAEIGTMRRLRRASDPNGILNPGKVFESRELR